MSEKFKTKQIFYITDDNGLFYAPREDAKLMLSNWSDNEKLAKEYEHLQQAVDEIYGFEAKGSFKINKRYVKTDLEEN